MTEEKDRPDFLEVRKLQKMTYIVSTRMKELMEVYADRLEYIPFVLTDAERGLQGNY